MNEIDALITQAADLWGRASHAVALTGAGISTPSGIPDFRSPGSGLWEKVDPFEVASIYGFRRQPQAFYDWMRPLVQLMLDAIPNPAHAALAELESAGLLQCVITQNIDMLHGRAGSNQVYEVHGHLRRATCISCQAVVAADTILITFSQTGQIPRCKACRGVLKPNVILFGELLPVEILREAEQHVRDCDLMLVAGSSLDVAPVGDLPVLARHSGATLIVVNYEDTHVDEIADVVIKADVAEVLPRLADAVIA